MIVLVGDERWLALIFSFGVDAAARAGLRVPEEVLQAAEQLTNYVKARQGTTDVAAPGVGVDVRAVAEPLLLTYAQAAGRLGVSRRTVERLVKAGSLMGTRVGGAARIRASDLAAYVEALGPRPFRQRIETKESA